MRYKITFNANCPIYGWQNNQVNTDIIADSLKDAIGSFKYMADLAGWEYVKTTDNVIFFKCKLGSAVAIITPQGGR